MGLLQGLEYLHHSRIGMHGRLTVSNCLVDSRWVVKLTEFGQEEILKTFRQRNALVSERTQRDVHCALRIWIDYRRLAFQSL